MLREEPCLERWKRRNRGKGRVNLLRYVLTQQYRVLVTPPTNDDDAGILDGPHNSAESSSPTPPPSPPLNCDDRFGSHVVELLFTMVELRLNTVANVASTSSESDMVSRRKSIIKSAFNISVDRVDLVNKTLGKIAKFLVDFVPESIDHSLICHEVLALLKLVVKLYSNWNWVLTMGNVRKLLNLIDFKSRRRFALYVVQIAVDHRYQILQEQTPRLLELLIPLLKHESLEQRPEEFVEDIKSLNRFMYRLSSTEPTEQCALLRAALGQLRNSTINNRLSYALQTLVLRAYEMAFIYGRVDAHERHCESMLFFCDDTIHFLICAGMKQIATSLLFIGIQVEAKIAYRGRVFTAKTIMAKVNTMYPPDGSNSDVTRQSVYKLIIHTVKINGIGDDPLFNQCLIATANSSDKARHAGEILEGLKQGLRMSEAEGAASTDPAQLHLILLHCHMYFLELGSEEISIEFVDQVFRKFELEIVPALESESSETSDEIKRQFKMTEKRMRELSSVYQGISFNADRASSP